MSVDILTLLEALQLSGSASLRFTAYVITMALTIREVLAFRDFLTCTFVVDVVGSPVP